MFCLHSDKRYSHLCRCHESRWRSGSRTPFILNLNTRCRPLVTIIPQPTDHGTHWISGWVGPQNQSQRFGEEKNLPMLGTKPQFLKYSLQVQCQKHITWKSTEYSSSWGGRYQCSAPDTEQLTKTWIHSRARYISMQMNIRKWTFHSAKFTCIKLHVM